MNNAEEKKGKDLILSSLMRFYTRLLSNRSYTYFEVLQVGLMLPLVTSSFNVIGASVSDYRIIRQEYRNTEQEKDNTSDGKVADKNEIVTTTNKIDKFNNRFNFKLSKNILESDLYSMSFIWFYRMYQVNSNVERDNDKDVEENEENGVVGRRPRKKRNLSLDTQYQLGRKQKEAVVHLTPRTPEAKVSIQHTSHANAAEIWIKAY